jgi:hypothetical protein
MSKMMLSPVFILTALSCAVFASRLFFYGGRLYYTLQKRPEPTQKSLAFYWRVISSEKGADDNQIEYLRIRTRESLGLTMVFSFGLLIICVSLKMAIVFMLGLLIIITFLRRR